MIREIVASALAPSSRNTAPRGRVVGRVGHAPSGRGTRRHMHDRFLTREIP